MTRSTLGKAKKKGAYLEIDSNTRGAVVIAPPPRIEHGVVRILKPLALTAHLERCPAHPLDVRVESVAFYRLALVEARLACRARHRLKDVARVGALRGNSLLPRRNREVSEMGGRRKGEERIV